MEYEETVKKIALKDLKTEAKKHGIPIGCRTKIDIAKDLPIDVLEKLANKWQIIMKKEIKWISKILQL